MRKHGTSDNSSCSGENTTTARNLTDGECSASRIEVPYTIIIILTLLAGILFVVLYIIPPPKGLKLFSLPKSSWKDVCSPGICAGGHARFAVIFISVLTVFYFFVTNSKYRAVTKSKYEWKVPEIAGLNRVATETMETAEVEQ